jgi:hypothetical protein
MLSSRARDFVRLRHHAAAARISRSAAARAPAVISAPASMRAIAAPQQTTWWATFGLMHRSKRPVIRSPNQRRSPHPVRFG